MGLRLLCMGLVNFDYSTLTQGLFRSFAEGSIGAHEVINNPVDIKIRNFR